MSQLLDLNSITKYLLAGKAVATFVSKRTGTRFTYRVTEQKARHENVRAFYIDVLTGSSNVTDFEPLAILCLRDGQLAFTHSTRSRIPVEALSAIAIRWIVQAVLVRRSEVALNQLSAYHEGHCGRCGRRLTTPTAIERGLGDKCARR